MPNTKDGEKYLPGMQLYRINGDTGLELINVNLPYSPEGYFLYESGQKLWVHDLYAKPLVARIDMLGRLRIQKDDLERKERCVLDQIRSHSNG